MASAVSATSPKTRGRPVTSSTATGFPVAFKAWKSSVWQEGSSSEARLAASPLSLDGSPTVSRTISERFASATASRIPPGIASRGLHPSTQTTEPCPKRSCRPARKVMHRPGSAIPLHAPDISIWLSAKGPIRAIRAAALRGRTLSSFFSSTMDLRASSRAVSRLLAEYSSSRQRPP